MSLHATRIPEIQGLRGLAVLAVLVFHAGLGFLPGGYLGVDMFFVISGYVIASLIDKQLATKTFTFAAFYYRRAWRLLPALAVTVLLTSIVFLVLTPSNSSPKLLSSLMTAMVGVSNLYFSAGVDYFESGTTNPVLHTWSLGVEEQFYLVFPLLMAWLGKQAWPNSKRLTWLLVLAVLGFVAAVVTTHLDVSAAFYHSWFRAWEFLAGALLALGTGKRLPAKWLQAGSWLGAVLVALALAFYDEHRLFPGIGALAPVLGTVLLMAGAGQGGVINAVLRWPVLTRIGDASYSFYLAHWPLVCLVTMFIPATQPKLQWLLLMASLVAGWVLWRLVEVPTLRRFRPAKQRTALLLIPGIMGLVLVSVVLIDRLSLALWQSVPHAQAYLEIKDPTTELFRIGDCFITLKTRFEDYKADGCAGSATASEQGLRVLVMGDSMAANIISALRKTWPQHQFIQATAVDYRPSLYGNLPEFSQQLDALIWEKWLGEKPTVDAVLFFAHWGDEDAPALTQTLQRLKAKGVKAFVVGPSPEFHIKLPLALAYSALLDRDLVPWLIKQQRFQLDQQFRAGTQGLAEYASMLDVTCPSRQCETKYIGTALYMDKVHFTRLGSELFVARLKLPGLTEPQKPAPATSPTPVAARP